ncbi:hypothetical protein Tco_1422228 [Tanacetum coccineum]
MLVQVYVDDIIFGSKTQSMYTEFKDYMHKRFQMSSIADILKKFDFCSIKTATTPIMSNKPLVKDEDGVDVDVHVYRSMIGSLMYLTASRPDIMYLKHQPKLGLWYPRNSPFELEDISDSDYGRASLDRKSITSGCQFLGQHLVLPGLVSTAQKYLTMEMMFGLGKKMLLGLVLEAKNGSFLIWCCQANLVLSGKLDAARQIWCRQAKVCAVCYRYYCYRA